jgi:membrane associated rhomboid family serine protease
MAWHDRDYNQDGFSGSQGGPGGRLGGASVVTWLLGINCIMFLLDGVLSSGTRSQAISPSYWGNFNLEQGLYGLQLWRWVSYQFLHHGFMHILFNMIGLYFFGPMLEKWWGSRRFLAFYLLCGVSGAFLMVLLSFVPGLLMIGPTTQLVGASGSLFGILAGAAVLFPHQRVMLMFPPIPMTLRTMALVFLGLAALSVVVGADNAGGEAAHLGGAILGFILVTHPRWLNLADRLSTTSIQDGVNKGRFERKQKREAADQVEVDRILDKVRDKGLGSLTRKEKNTLNEATERQNRAG